MDRRSLIKNAGIAGAVAAGAALVACGKKEEAPAAPNIVSSAGACHQVFLKHLILYLVLQKCLPSK
jgi:hypothetical protein